MLGIPPETKFDVTFRLLSIPVRVSAWFWVVALMFNVEHLLDSRILIWVACLFVSILVHEFGHALTGKLFGDRPHVILHGMGGVCVSDVQQPFGRRLAVLFMGPMAQFLLLGLVLSFGAIYWKVGLGGDLFLIRYIFGFPPEHFPISAISLFEFELQHPLAGFAFENLVRINLLWPLINLLPIWPLDGGQITQTVLNRFDRAHGSRRTHIVGMLAAGIITAFLASRIQGLGAGQAAFFPVVFFGYFAFLNYQQVQAYHQHYVENGEDNADWWKR